MVHQLQLMPGFLLGCLSAMVDGMLRTVMSRTLWRADYLCPNVLVFNSSCNLYDTFFVILAQLPTTYLGVMHDLSGRWIFCLLNAMN